MSWQQTDRACTYEDVVIYYRAGYKVDKNLNPTESLGEEYDEYHCTNCEEYFEYGGNIEQHLEEQKVGVK